MIAPDDQGTSLLMTVVTALYEDGRTVDVDWDLEVFDLAPRTSGGETLLGVVMDQTREVVFYAVRPEYVPTPARAAVAELVTRQNTELFSSAFELNLATGSLSLRCGLLVPDVELPLEVLQALLRRMIAEVETVRRRTHARIEAVIEDEVRADGAADQPAGAGLAADPA